MISSFSFLLEYRNLCVLSNYMYMFLSITFLWMNCLCISPSNLKWWHIYLKKYRYHERMSVMWYSTFLFHIFMIYYLHILLLDLFSHTWHFTSWFWELVDSAWLAAYVIWTMNGICFWGVDHMTTVDSMIDNAIRFIEWIECAYGDTYLHMYLFSSVFFSL